MRGRTRRFVVYTSIIAVLLIGLSTVQQGDVTRQTGPEVAAARQSSVGPRLFRPRAMPPSAPAISVRVVDFPGVVATSQAGRLAAGDGETASLQDENVRLQI